jgi:hypothetical protein
VAHQHDLLEIMLANQLNHLLDMRVERAARLERQRGAIDLAALLFEQRLDGGPAAAPMPGTMHKYNHCHSHSFSAGRTTARRR